MFNFFSIRKFLHQALNESTLCLFTPAFDFIKQLLMSQFFFFPSHSSFDPKRSSIFFTFKSDLFYELMAKYSSHPNCRKWGIVFLQITL